MCVRVWTRLLFLLLLFIYLFIVAAATAANAAFVVVSLINANLIVTGIIVIIIIEFRFVFYDLLNLIKTWISMHTYLYQIHQCESMTYILLTVCR